MADDHHYAFYARFLPPLAARSALIFFQQGGGAVFTADQIRVFSPPLSGKLAAEGFCRIDWVRLLTRGSGRC